MAEVVLATSNFCLPKRVLASGSRRAHVNFIEQAGYRHGHERSSAYAGGGFELSEIRGLLGRATVRRLVSDDDVASLHQSWRSTRWSEIGGMFKKRGAAGLLLMLGVPPLEGSLGRLARLQHGGKLLPVVTHPNEQQPPDEQPHFSILYKYLASRFKELRYQPTAEQLQGWGVPLSGNAHELAERLIVEQRERGFGGVAVDTRHIVEERHGLRIKDPYALVGALGKRGVLHEVQVNFTSRADTLRHVLDHGLDMTPDGNLLETALATVAPSQELLVVTEVSPADFAQIGMNNVVQGHQRLVDAIAHILPAQPR